MLLMSKKLQPNYLLHYFNFVTSLHNLSSRKELVKKNYATNYLKALPSFFIYFSPNPLNTLCHIAHLGLWSSTEWG